jgi:glucose/mannose transport system substrate-binding protein
MSKAKIWYILLAVLVIFSLSLAACQAGVEEPAPEEPEAEEAAVEESAEEEAAEEPAEEETTAGELEIFSWWTAGGEAEGLNAMFEIFSSQYPDVEIINATVAGGAGTNAKAVLATRLQGGDPPDSFQVHAGLEVEKYEPDTFLEPIEDKFDFSVFPPDLLTLLEYEGHIWSMPVNIHRSNVLWYNEAIFEEYDLEVPMTKEEFFEVSETLMAEGIIPVTMGTKDGWEAAHVFEGLLAATLGAEDYRGLWTGDTSWEDARVTEALEYFNEMMKYVNEDNAAMTWDGAGEYFLEDQAAMMIMGDWTAGWFASKGFADYGWAATPGSDGIFVALSDSFALPQGAPNAETAEAWLAVCHSKEGQEAFNPAKGSICARTDCDNEAFKAVPETYDYLTSAADDWATDAIVPSVVHGAASFESWATDWKDTISLFVASGDVEGTQASLQALCVDAGVCE